MLSFFKSNHPKTVILLFFYLAVLKLFLIWAPLQWAGIVFPLSGMVYDLLKYIPLQESYSQSILSVLLIFAHAVYLNHISNKYKILKKPSHLIGLSYILLTSFFIQFSYLSPALMANTFLLIVIDILFSIYKREKTYAEAFDIFFLISIASLFYAPAIFLVLLGFIGLITLQPFKWKVWVIALLGILTPYFLTATWYFWTDNMRYFYGEFIMGLIQNPLVLIPVEREYIIKISLLMLLFAWSFINIQAYFFKSLQQIRKYLIILFWLFIAGFFADFIQYKVTLHSFVNLAIPSAVFLAYNFLETRKQLIMEIFHAILMIVIVYYQFVNIF